MELRMPLLSIAYYSISVVAFIYAMLSHLYGGDVEAVLVYVLYALMGLFSMVFGGYLIALYNRKQES